MQSDASTTPNLKPGLYIVATPIGNLGDITVRSIDVLKRCDAVACEDTRVTGKLLKHLGIAKPLWRYDDHTGEEARTRIVSAAAGQAVALLSDAGTPIVSDPGHRLVEAAYAAGVEVTSLPGPCAAIAGLTLSGLPNDRFLFAGFMPSKAKARTDLLAELCNVRATVIFYETAPRLTKTLEALSELWPERPVAVARELTKLHEECRRGSARELKLHYEEKPPKGEIVLLVGPPVAKHADAGDVDALLTDALETLKPSQAAAQVAKATGEDRKALYARALELQRQ
ncbi:16S rRNA (cytidine(1402)-2'-O)-methyltransferase [Qipengyuania atrilutea]|uniref:16S rRNA (cytidine(1402)-2'-O)-methyltransferase n=1 Tax=Qipengyuania atrilutea TaxID=2744473 RepID=UPI00298E40ED|nr:16S rRNA (cytidine(1402)-2'-O)-methyltransferase [Actirhodobacter atriluteus]